MLQFLPLDILEAAAQEVELINVDSDLTNICCLETYVALMRCYVFFLPMEFIVQFLFFSLLVLINFCGLQLGLNYYLHPIGTLKA